MSKKFISFVLFFTILTSCATLKQPKADLQNVTYKMLLEHHTEWMKAVKTLSGDLRITLDTPQYSGNFNASVLMNAPDSFLVTVTGPFGMNLGKVFMSHSRFVFYNQVMDQFITGSKDDFEGRNFLQFPVEINQLRNVLIAQDNFTVLQKRLFEVRDDQYYLEASNGNSNYNIWFEPSHLLIKRIEQVKDGKLQYYKDYDNFRKVNGIYFPQLVNFVKPDKKQGISVIITDLALNEPIDRESYKIRVSDSAKQIDLTL